MRLIELRANHESFHTIRFNRSGLTLIVGSKSAKGNTYNGVGKSLIIELLHFCLGSRSNKEFEEKLPGWEFTLAFEFSGEQRGHTVSRNTSKQKVVYVDDEEMKVSEFTDWMSTRIFSIPDDVPGLSFRTLLPRFLRRGIGDYTDPLKTTSDHTPYDALVRNGFLLGLDVHLIARKEQLHDEKVKIERLRANFRDDPMLRQFYSGTRDPDIHLAYLERKLEDLQRNRDSFVVAENYYDLQRGADELAAEVERQKNEAFLLRDAISNIELSIREQPDLQGEQVSHLYRELREAFREQSLKRLEEVTGFHHRLLQSRISRLSGERLRLRRALDAQEAVIQRNQVELNHRLQVLGSAGALDQYTAIVSEIAEVTAQIQKLRDYQAIELEYSNRAATVEKQLSDEIIHTNAYLEDARAERELTFDTFKGFVRWFYPNVPAGISVRNNERMNAIRFDLDVRIENDSSDGINEVKIFCYDALLLGHGKHHRMKFVFHDSRLYANMDVRQRAGLFRLASKMTNKQQLQYIATLNPDEVSGMEGEFDSDEFKSLIQDNVVLNLTDESPAGKLLGIQLDLRYEPRKVA